MGAKEENLELRAGVVGLAWHPEQAPGMVKVAVLERAVLMPVKVWRAEVVTRCQLGEVQAAAGYLAEVTGSPIGLARISAALRVLVLGEPGAVVAHWHHGVHDVDVRGEVDGALLRGWRCAERVAAALQTQAPPEAVEALGGALGSLLG